METVNGINIYRLPIGHKRRGRLNYIIEYVLGVFLASLWFSVLMLHKRYQLVQVHTPPDALVFAALLPKLMLRPVILDLHDPMPEAMITKFGIGLNHWLSRLVLLQEKVSLGFADYIITVTAQVKQALLGRSVHENKISVIMNFADRQIFGKHEGEPSKQSHNDDFVIIYIGTLSHQYGVDIAIQALKKLKEHIPNVQLKIIGDGEERSFLGNQVVLLELTDNVRFIGQVPIDHIPDIALPAHVGIAPHRKDLLYDMCFPSKIYDYLALGLAVVSARTESIEYYYGKNVISFFESEDVEGLAEQIYSLYTNPQRLDNMRKNADTFLRIHNWDNESLRYVFIIDEWLQRK